MAQYSFKYAVGEEVKIYDSGLLYDLTSFEVDPKYLRTALVVGINIYMEKYEYKVFKYDTNSVSTVDEKCIFPIYDEVVQSDYEYVEEVDDENEPTLDEIQQSL